MRRHHLLHRPARGRQELPDHPDAVEGWLAPAEMTGDEDGQADIPVVPVVAVGVQLRFVAEQRCHLGGVDGTARPHRNALDARIVDHDGGQC
jgi:hypothetical protein